MGQSVESSREIRAVFTQDWIRVYQAYNAAIAAEAIRLQHFGSKFSFNRMTWIKPSFLWMMYRSGWASKENQEHILALDLKREGFELMLKSAVPSTFAAWQQSAHIQQASASAPASALAQAQEHAQKQALAQPQTQVPNQALSSVPAQALSSAQVQAQSEGKNSQTMDEWKDALASSQVRVQWDPERDIYGNPLAQVRSLQLGIRGEMLQRLNQEWILKIEDITPFVLQQKALIDQGRTSELSLPPEHCYVVP